MAVENTVYDAYIGYRDGWAQERDDCDRMEAQLEEQIRRLKDTLSRLLVHEEQINDILSGLRMIPDSCSLWKGARAEDFFLQCTQGDLYEGYHRIRETVETTVQELESKLQNLQSRLYQVRENRRTADYYYGLWDQQADALYIQGDAS